ncbi:uncharacterized protein JCM6883_004279 [Sporobolomyces salmoneus]|uniref:uncharacterized protein n=1 Tax=Sporobolomyces salmoneus TaxID=183962 RepID=UPI00317CA274
MADTSAPSACSTERTPLLQPASASSSSPSFTLPSSARSKAPVNDPETANENGNDQAKTLPPRSEKSLFRRTVQFLLIWASISIVVVVCIVQSIRKGNGEFDWKGAFKKAGGGGLAGALSMVLQVLLLLPLRTIMNYQYRHGGTSFVSSYRLLLSSSNGHHSRLYAGLLPALIQGPVARFGDTASNAGVLALLNSHEWLKGLPTGVKTAAGSLLGALFRMVLMPVDTLKTTMQTEGNKKALVVLKERIVRYGPGTLWSGAWATAAANFVGSFPWFATYNYLSLHLPLPSAPDHSHFGFILLNLSRQALIGFISSVVSDTISNSLRVVKTFRQTAQEDIGYRQATREIIKKEGLKGLFGRGLRTRLLANGLQGIIFSVLWKLFQDLLSNGHGGGQGRG